MDVNLVEEPSNWSDTIKIGDGIVLKSICNAKLMSKKQKCKEKLSLQIKETNNITHHRQSLGFQVLFPFLVETKISPC